MAEYLVKSTNTRTFTLMADAAVLGELKYKEWFSFKATLTLADGRALQIEPKGFWGTTIELKEQGAVVLSFRMNWDGSIVLKSRLGEESHAFVLKSRSLLKNSYVLLDKKGRELLAIQPDFKWSSVNYDYTISSTELFEALAAKDTLVAMAIHGTNYYMTMMTSALTSSVILTA